VAEVQCDGDACIYYKKNNGAQWSIVDKGVIKEGNLMQQKAIVQEKGRFSAEWKNGTTFIWDNVAHKKVGNVNFPFGLLQDMDVLFCSESSGVILYQPIVRLLFVFDGTAGRGLTY